LLRGDLSGLVQRNPVEGNDAHIRQNLAFAFLYNAAGVPVAAGCSIHCSDCCCRQWWGRRHGAVIGQRDRQRAAMARLRV